MTRSINFGLWYDFRNPLPRAMSFETLYSETLLQMEWAETLGYDSVWFTEHHFCEDGYSPSPMIIASAIAQRTKKLRIGTDLVLLPLADPIRLAEESATLSILSGGRFDLGVGLGYRELEFEYFGRKISHRPSLMEEGVAIIRKAWTGENIEFHGKRFTVDNLSVQPTPEILPKLYIGGHAQPAIERAARIADGYLSGGRSHSEYVTALKKAGKRRSEGKICAGNWWIIADDPERELEQIGKHLLYQANQYITWGAFGPPDQTPLFPDAKSAVEYGLYDLKDSAMAVSSLVAMLKEFPEIIDVHFWAQFPGESISSGNKRIEYIANRVIPEVREALALEES